MPAPRPNDEEIRKRFNKLVGTRTGKPSRPAKAVSKPAIKQRRALSDIGAGRQAIQTLVAHGGGKVPSSVRSKQKAWFGTGSGTEYTDPVGGANKAFENIYDKLSQELNQQSTAQNAVRTAYAADVLDKQVDPEAPEKFYETFDGKTVEVKLTPSIDEQYLGGNLNKYVMDPLARAGSVIPASLKGLAEGGYNARDEGAGYWEQTWEGLKEAQKAGTQTLRGENYQGFGDLYEVMKDRGDNYLSEGTRWLEKEHPFIEEQVSRAAGFAGEYYGHPLGRMVGGTKAGVVDGKLATPESIRAAAEDMAKRYAADAESQIVTGAAKAPGGYRPFPSEAAMADHFEKSLTDAFDTAELQINSGGSKGRYNILNPKMTAGLAAAHGSQSLLDSLTSLFGVLLTVWKVGDLSFPVMLWINGLH
jgi:hypothetical protein